MCGSKTWLSFVPPLPLFDLISLDDLHRVSFLLKKKKKRLNLSLIDYAVGGATTNNTRIPAYLTLNNQTITIPSALDQIDTFISKANSSLANATISNTLFGIWIGANDIFDALSTNKTINGVELVSDIWVGIERLKAIGTSLCV